MPDWSYYPQLVKRLTKLNFPQVIGLFFWAHYMDELLFMRDAIAQNAKDIKELSALFHSSISDLKQLHETQRLLIELLQAKVQASAEISSIKETLNHINTHLSNIEIRLTTMEQVHGSEMSRQKGKYDFIKIVDAIGKVAIMAVLFSLFIVNPVDVRNYVFGSHEQQQTTGNH